jgi:outer membrane receptor protein involved in Fe transport
LGYSPFSYNYKNISVTDVYWNQTVSQDIENIKTSRTWLELVAGVRVEIAKNIFMGWSVRNKKLFGTDLPGELSPYYIPCFGVKGDGKAWGVNYSVGYRF